MTSLEIALVAAAIPLWAIFIGQLIPPKVMDRFSRTSVGGFFDTLWERLEGGVAWALRIKR
jgi:hypothetical protein